MRAHVLDIRDLHLSLGGRPVLQGIDLRIDSGEFVALAGPNGSGKSSLLRCIAGLLLAHRGTIEICSHPIATHTAAARAKFGMAVDPAALPGLLTGRECLQLFARTRGLGEVPAATLALAEALRYSVYLDRPVEEYSLGTRQKLAVLLGLIGEPPLLLLDEPLNGLDPPSAWALKRHLAELAARGTAIVLATHAIELAERHVHRAVLLVEGRRRLDLDSAALAALRADPHRSLEAELVAAMGS
ncbi:MAG: ATP-binding cassette domain-containing protein [Lysobacterales bacterium]